MNITKLKGSNKRSGLCLLKIGGDLNIYNAAESHESLLEFVDNFKEFEVDMSSVNEIDTAGIQLLLQLKRKAAQEERSIQLSGCNEQVCDLLDLYQLQDWLAPVTSKNTTTEGV
jgi:anti-sigma B factor antagonist